MASHESEHEPSAEGPRRVTQAEIRATFAQGWRIQAIREVTFESDPSISGNRAWLSIIIRSPEASDT
jgi:hypothetical protein